MQGFVANQAKTEVSKTAQQLVILVPGHRLTLFDIIHLQMMKGNRSAPRSCLDARRHVRLLKFGDWDIWSRQRSIKGRNESAIPRSEERPKAPKLPAIYPVNLALADAFVPERKGCTTPPFIIVGR